MSLTQTHAHYHLNSLPFGDFLLLAMSETFQVALALASFAFEIRVYKTLLCAYSELERLTHLFPVRASSIIQMKRVHLMPFHRLVMTKHAH